MAWWKWGGFPISMDSHSFTDIYRNNNAEIAPYVAEGGLTRNDILDTCSLYWFSTSTFNFLFLPSFTSPDLSLLPILLMLYWNDAPIANSIGTSFLPYSLNPHFQTFLSNPNYYLPNFAVTIFPNEIAIVPEAWVRKTGKCNWYKGQFFPFTDDRKKVD